MDKVIGSDPSSPAGSQTRAPAPAPEKPGRRPGPDPIKKGLEPSGAGACLGWAAARRAGSRPKKQGKPRGVHRHGVPLLPEHIDFECLFQADDPPQRHIREDAAEPEANPPSSGSRVDVRPSRAGYRNRHGIPLFTPDADLAQQFQAAESRAARRASGRTSRSGRKEASGDFARMVAETLDGKTQEELLREKQDLLEGIAAREANPSLSLYPPPQEELDLHGFTAADAAARVESFVKIARGRGKRTLLIIVGKGIHSEGRPVLPDIVEDKIVELRRRNWIRAFEWEKGVKRRSGALIVYLNAIGR